jgi:hypothetical protein
MFDSRGDVFTRDKSEASLPGIVDVVDGSPGDLAEVTQSFSLRGASDVKISNRARDGLFCPPG